MERPYLILSLRNTYRGNVDFMSVSRVISSTQRKSIQNQGGRGGGGGRGGVLLCFAQSPTQVYVVFDLPLIT